MKKKEEEKKITEVNRLIFICYVTKLRKCRIWKKKMTLNSKLFKAHERVDVADENLAI